MSATAIVFLHAAQDACAGLAGVGCVYLIVAAFTLRRFSAPAPPRSDLHGARPTVVILKPLYGADDGLERRLTGFCTQDYPGSFQIVLGIQDPRDPALQAARAVEAAYPQRVGVQVSARQHGTNRKLSNLINMDADRREDVVVLCDSDIEVGPDYLRAVVSALQQPNVGAVTCLYHGLPTAGIWSSLAALAINTHFLPNAAAAASWHFARPCFGSTIALRRATLERIGGFEAFADCLADDYAIGEAVRALGSAVAIPSFSIGHVCLIDNFAAYWTQALRVARTIKSIDSVGHAGAVVTHPFALGLLTVLLGAGWYGAALAAAALLCRLLLCGAVTRAFKLPRPPYRLVPLQDILAFAVFAASFFGSRVHWAGADYEVTAMGRLAAHRGRVWS